MMYSEKQRIRQAYMDGEKPLSKWTKAEIMQEIVRMNNKGEVSLDDILDDIKAMPLPQMKKYLLYKTSCHNTGNVKRHTYFYSVDKASLEHLTKGRIRQISGEKEAASPMRRCVCSFLEWQGPRRRPAATRLTEEGYIKGEWFYRKNGTRKSVRSAGFMCIKDIKEATQG